jgi:hypothetical protein
VPTETAHRKNIGEVVVSVLLIGAGCLVLWDTTTYADPDSAVFPRTFAIVMIGACIAYIGLWLLGRGENRPEPEAGSMIRRVLLVAVMLAGAVAMPWIGFLAAAIPVFAGLLLVAMYDPWTPYRAIVYPLIGLALVFGFYFVFQELLLVPLPTGKLFP